VINFTIANITKAIIKAKNMTLKELYLRQKNKTAPGLAFIREVAMVTKK